MRKIFRYTALVCASAAVAISCVEENLEPVIPAVDGDAIVFGVRAGFEDSAPGTKTEYSGEDYSYGGKTFERIDWVVNDKIEIYSPQAENPLATTERPKSTHYVVTNVSAGDESENDGTNKGKDFAKLANVGEAGLRWNGTQKYDFYAMYPSSEMFRPAVGDIPANIKSGVFMGTDKEDDSKVMVYGIVSDVQQPTVVPDPNNPGSYIAKPDMNNAYMVAKTSVDHPTQSSQVKLSFVPIVTAVEIELVNIASSAVTIREIQVASDEPIVGGFTADLSGWTGTYPTCTNLTAASEATDAEKEIQVTTLIKSDDSYTGVSLAPDATLKFTVFLLPGSDIENLIVRVSGGYTYLSKNLNNANIPANLKTRIRGLNLPGDPKEFESGGDNWMEQITPESVIKSLSLPGTGGSFTSESDASFRQQDLTFDEQWSLGVRAFELSSDRPSSATTSLGGEAITCNKVDVVDTTGKTITVITAIRNILAKLDKFPTETAALILTYQPEDASPNRNVASYAQSLSVMLNGNGTTGTGNTLSKDEVDMIIPYTTTLTMDHTEASSGARGKLILICRPNQNDETDNGSYTTALNYLSASKLTAINGCGTAKDRWGARGYKVFQSKGSFTQGAESDPSLFNPDRLCWADKSYTLYESQAAFKALDLSNEGVDNGTTNQGLSNTSDRPSSTSDTRTGYDILGPNYVEYFMSNANAYIFPSENNTYTAENGSGVIRPDSSKPNQLDFEFETNITGTKCWFQDWARVIPENTHAEGEWDDGSSSGDYDIYWFESYDEKLSNVKTTFDMAIENYNPSYIYINSLCGYLATPDTDKSPTWSLAPSMPFTTWYVRSSIWGGAGGDIKALSDKLNPDFYNYVVEKGLGAGNQVTGPTGIVLMDFVMKAKDDNGNTVRDYNSTEDLIQAIIANNQKYSTSGPTLDNTNKEEGTETPINPF